MLITNQKLQTNTLNNIQQLMKFMILIIIHLILNITFLCFFVLDKSMMFLNVTMSVKIPLTIKDLYSLDANTHFILIRINIIAFNFVLVEDMKTKIIPFLRLQIFFKLLNYQMLLMLTSILSEPIGQRCTRIAKMVNIYKMEKAYMNPASLYYLIFLQLKWLVKYHSLAHPSVKIETDIQFMFFVAFLIQITIQQYTQMNQDIIKMKLIMSIKFFSQKKEEKKFLLKKINKKTKEQKCFSFKSVNQQNKFK
ncbi:transmembrane protein, putative (macronuclear) [Tetrahymena thermophila SB210]|uniref:Transmembrane protein, putative n=1 Tax=Tetrahymena thermophila (strain SB210) TaxID=312017 RepID=W7XFK4_TETTS|nr:transmembrane protein, putative [Tetrahymena thermophila SB210]EWS76632.1 transmembrane protein, putative [Tetrahymena thermophila SB210]|eukprot:XP_012650800.1 transmembrane protein, putative [Tetrahymena thermophila SB210]